MRNNKIIVLVECALAIALAIVLNLVAARLPINVAGGSISLTMLPIVIVALRRGPTAGALCGAVFGMFNFFLGPFIVHWAQVILDYPAPYLLLGLGVGLFAKPYAHALEQAASNTSGATLTRGSVFVVVALMVGGILRYITHVLSGVIFFAEYAGDQNVWVYSLVYNISYLLPSLVATLVLALVLMPILARTIPATRQARLL